MNWSRGGKKSVHVWLPADLVEKIKAENVKVNEKGGCSYNWERIQATYERILSKFFEAPETKKKKK